MIATGTIYRVVESPTACAYAASADGVTVEWFDSYKQAARRYGDLPLTIVTRKQWDAPAMYVVCRGCGEAFDDLAIAYAHGDDGCGSDGWDVLPESEAM